MQFFPEILQKPNPANANLDKTFTLAKQSIIFHPVEDTQEDTTFSLSPY